MNLRLLRCLLVQVQTRMKWFSQPQACCSLNEDSINLFWLANFMTKSCHCFRKCNRGVNAFIWLKKFLGESLYTYLNPVSWWSLWRCHGTTQCNTPLVFCCVASRLQLWSSSAFSSVQVVKIIICLFVVRKSLWIATRPKLQTPKNWIFPLS